MLSENQKQYISDLLKSNGGDFARINSLENRIKEYRKQRYELEHFGMKKQTCLKVVDLTSNILICYDEIRHLRGVINARLEEIKHVRGLANYGTKPEVQSIPN